MDPHPPTIGLALCGGGARGLCHVGVLQVLVRENIPVHIITGASFGAIIGAIYAHTPDIGHLEREVERVLTGDRFRKARGNFVRHEFAEERHLGLISNVKKFVRREIFYGVALRMRQLVGEAEFTAIIDDLVPDVHIENMAIPYACVATDITHGTELILDEGPLRPAVYGSAAIPGVFPPIAYRGRHLVDGGWSNRVPVAPARAMGADLVVGIDIVENFEDEPVESLKNGLELLIRANRVTSRLLCNAQIEAADVVVRPEVGHLHWAAFDHAEFCIRAGATAMEAALPALHERIAEHQPRGLARFFRSRRTPRRGKAGEPS